MDNLNFFKQLSQKISSSMEPADAWISTFNYLERQFPIEAISMHICSPHLEFMVQQGQFVELNRIMMPLWEKEEIEPLRTSPGRNIINIPFVSKQPTAAKLLKKLQAHLTTNQDRALLVIVLVANEGIIGQLCLIGKTVDCFTAEHEKRLELIQAPLSLAFMSLHRYCQTQELKSRIDAERLQLKGTVRLLKDSSIIGADSGLRSTMIFVEQLAGKETPALILGETGTGKEMIADAIQRVSPRNNKPYIKINCGAIPETLIDSELFGHQKGAFTGATSSKIGRFEQADGGTLFLDEVGELPMQAQVRLLRVLQNGSFERVGGEKPIRVDVRIIAATNRPLEEMIESGKFRSDLFYRLNVFPILLPPLRERPDDIPLLIRHFIRELSVKLKLSQILPISAESIEQLRDYPWPGNVRELKNLVERAITIDPESDLDLTRFLPQTATQPLENQSAPAEELEAIVERLVQKALTKQDVVTSKTTPEPQQPGSESLDTVMALHITKVLDQCHGRINGPGGAAERLAINPSTLRKRLHKLGIPFGSQS